MNKTTPWGVRLDPDTVARLEAVRSKLSTSPVVRVSRVDALRAVVDRGLRAIESEHPTAGPTDE